MDTYRNIGEAFQYVEQIEDYGVGARSASPLGLWFSGSKADDEGVTMMLLETQTDFEVVDPKADLSRYEAIVLPGATCLTEAQAKALNHFAQDGGGLLVLGESALDATKTKFIVDVGTTFLGPGEFDIDYLVAGKAVGDNIVSRPFLNYEAAMRVQPDPDVEILATIREPYFSRTYATFCSHRNTPHRPEDAAHPGIVRKGNVVFMAHALGRI
jgi:hypothetical protein